ncbi:high-affinity iron transporter [Enterococcus sp. DIV2402]|uniref:High-affinity iron transporter n=2 Tax=Candidatus Enterococcus lowellii TaxID=2230877 RepID=A0ABZ2SQ09_9ENTE
MLVQIFLSVSLFFAFLTTTNHRADEIAFDIAQPTASIEETLSWVDQADFDKAEQTYQEVKKWWTMEKQAAKKKNTTVAQQIDLKVGQASIALLLEDSTEAKKELIALEQAIVAMNQQEHSLGAYINKLVQLKTMVQEESWEEVQVTTEQLASEWLSVEGDVVSRSQAIYDHSEKNLLDLKHAAETKNKEAILATIDDMQKELSSIDSADYSIIDVAMIPFREGLEAMLIISLLLSVVKQRENSKKAKRWILGGSVLGGLTSLAIGVLVYYVLSVVAFGTNSQLINGYSGVFSSVMLVFVGIWMHKSSDVQKMTSFYKEKSQNSATGGVVGLAALAFLAVIREGLEIVIFIIGLVGKVSMQQLIAGFLLGTFLLAVVAIVLFVFERRLPLKAFFTLSSLVIFYLAIKFMGSGIHSLQLANQLPNQVETYLPTVTALSIYPSWISFIPQLLIIGIIIVYLLQRKKENSHEK